MIFLVPAIKYPPSPPAVGDAATIGMLHVQNSLCSPMKVVSNEGYLLVEQFQGVAYNPPSAFNSV